MKRLLSVTMVLLLIIMSMPFATFAESSLGVSVDSVTQNSAAATITGETTGSTITATLSPNDGSIQVVGTSVSMSSLNPNTDYELTILEEIDQYDTVSYDVQREGSVFDRRYYYKSPNSPNPNQKIYVEYSSVYHVYYWLGIRVVGNGYLPGVDNKVDVYEKVGTTTNTATTTFKTEAETFTLSVNTVGNGSVSRDIEGPYTAGALVELTATPDLNNHFAGWSDALGTESVISVTVNSNMTITANFELDQYQVRFMDEETVLDSSMVDHGGFASLPPQPSKDHYVFNDWYIGVTPFDPNTPITEATDIEATWLPVNMYFTVDNIIEIYHNGNLLTPVHTPSGGSYDWQKIKHYYADLQEGDVIAVKGTDEGVVAGMLGQILFEGAHPTQTDSHWRYSTDLHEGWNNKGFTMDESWNEVFEPTYSWSGLVGVPSGFNAKWIWSPNYETPNNGDTVVYFRYVIGGYQQPDPEPVTAIITFDTDGGSTVNPITINEGTSLNSNEIALPIPSKDGHTFLRWSYDEDSTFDGSTVVDNSMTVVAIYSLNQNNENEDENEEDDTPVVDNTPAPVVFIPATEVIEDEETPLSAASSFEFFNVDNFYDEPVTEKEEEIVLDEEIILDEATPLADALPQTGQLPPQAFIGLGGLVTAIGAFMKKKNR